MCERLVVGGSNKLFDAEPSQSACARSRTEREARHTRTVHDGRRKHRGLREEPPLLHHRRVADGGVQQRVRSREGGLHRGGEGPRGQVQGVRLRVLRARGGCGVGGGQEQVVQGGRPRGDHRHRQQEGPGHQGVHRQISPERRRRRRRDRGREGVARGARRPPGRGPSPGDSDSDAPKEEFKLTGPVHGDFLAKPKQPRPARRSAPASHPALAADRAPRTVALAGLRLAGEPEGIDPDAALDAARACGDVEEVTSPAPKDVVDAAHLRHDGATRGVLLVTYEYRGGGANGGDEATQHDARRGQAQGARVKAQLAEGGAAAANAANRGRAGAGPDAGVSAVELLWARQLGHCEGARPKSWRVIIRNLAFKATEEDMRTAMSKAGFVWDLTVPRDFHDKPKGFAFAAFTAKSDASAR